MDGFTATPIGATPAPNTDQWQKVAQGFTYPGNQHTNGSTGAKTDPDTRTQPGGQSWLRKHLEAPV
ncbi:hypothetical protein GCM10007392_37970 [Saccharospirillum salsuginis]|uniref:Uncharacterized protein n=1 Tax=Saccharospirillum salsuginis TaxID=418750 RepID=A0A918KL61_9GAMM|nr:hypothetical protein GCM10007392_37970 [Saccharospirillum salsuginis]